MCKSLRTHPKVLGHVISADCVYKGTSKVSLAATLLVRFVEEAEWLVVHLAGTT